MPNPVGALAGARAQGIVGIAEAAPQGMVSLRAEIEGATVKSAVGRVAGVEIPERGAVTTGAGRDLMWMSPDELLLLCERAEAADLASDLNAALDGRPHLVADVSDARAVIELRGAKLRDVLAKLTPTDMRPQSFAPGQVRRTRLAQVPAAIWLVSEDDARVFAFRSVAHYVFEILKTAAEPGAALGHY